MDGEGANCAVQNWGYNNMHRTYKSCFRIYHWSPANYFLSYFSYSEVARDSKVFLTFEYHCHRFSRWLADSCVPPAREPSVKNCHCKATIIPVSGCQQTILPLTQISLSLWITYCRKLTVRISDIFICENCFGAYCESRFVTWWNFVLLFLKTCLCKEKTRTYRVVWFLRCGRSFKWLCISTFSSSSWIRDHLRR